MVFREVGLYQLDGEEKMLLLESIKNKSIAMYRTIPSTREQIEEALSDSYISVLEEEAAKRYRIRTEREIKVKLSKEEVLDFYVIMELS